MPGVVAGVDSVHAANIEDYCWTASDNARRWQGTNAKGTHRLSAYLAHRNCSRSQIDCRVTAWLYRCCRGTSRLADQETLTTSCGRVEGSLGLANRANYQKP
jgi:hypothetical protein